MAKKKSQFWESGLLNNATYMQYYNRLTELSISMFDWKNLPPSVDPRFLELTLFSKGAAVFFKDEDMEEDKQLLALQVLMQGDFDIYNIPRNRTAFAGYDRGYQKRLNEKNSVIIWNNLLHKNSMLDVRMFATRLYNLDRAIDVNANAQKTPILITCDETEKLTMENIYQKYDGNAPVIFGHKGLNATQIGVLNTDAPYVADKLYTLKTQIWNEALTYLGISNINVQKKERLITDEVTRNQGGVIASRYSRLEARRQAADEINKMFDLNIKVDYREDYQVVDDNIDNTTGDGEDYE